MTMVGRICYATMAQAANRAGLGGSADPGGQALDVSEPHGCHRQCLPARTAMWPTATSLLSREAAGTQGASRRKTACLRNGHGDC